MLPMRPKYVMFQSFFWFGMPLLLLCLAVVRDCWPVFEIAMLLRICAFVVTTVTPAGYWLGPLRVPPPQWADTVRGTVVLGTLLADGLLFTWVVL